MTKYHVITADRYLHGPFGTIEGAKAYVRRWACDDRRVPASKVFVKLGADWWEFKRPFDVTKPMPKPRVYVVATSALFREFPGLPGARV